MVRCQIPLRHPPRRPVRGYPPDFRRIPGSIFQQAGRRGGRYRRAAGQIRRTARGTSRHVQDAGCQEFCLYACLCENGFCIHLYAGLRRPLPRRPDPEGDCLGAGAMPEDSPAAPDGGDRPLAGGFPRHGRHGVGGRPILPERRLLRQKRENPAGYRGRIYFDRPEPGRRTGCPDISGFTADVPGILHETGNSRLPANRIHHPQKRDLLCLPRRSGGTESGSDRRFGHHTDPGGFRR